jgi:Carboxypeptidase regulatory-like domain
MVTSTTKSVSRETLTNADGLYAIPSLPAGTYDLQVESAGFALSVARM